MQAFLAKYKLNRQHRVFNFRWARNEEKATKIWGINLPVFNSSDTLKGINLPILFKLRHTLGN